MPHPSIQAASGGRGVTRGRAARIYVLGLLAVATLASPIATAQAASPVDAARQVLRLSDQRLSLMREVMASKWASRSPVEDLAQEGRVIAGARNAARAHGLEPAGVAAVFRSEIDTAKEVELGWGGQWLLHGFPPDEPMPDLAELRDQLSGLSEQIVAALGRLDGLRCRPHLDDVLRRESRHLIRTRYVTDAARDGLVRALLSVRSGHAPACGSGPHSGSPGR